MALAINSEREREPVKHEVTAFWPERERNLVLALAQAVGSAGGRLFAVGGAVRDPLRGTPVGDLDVEVYGLSPDQLEGILKRHAPADLVGRAFAVWKLRGVDVDVALPRQEVATGRGHRDFEIKVDPNLPLPVAARRRDFTINALLWDPLQEELVDPTGGGADLRRGVLRHTSPQFAEDPLRVLRAMQFAARFDFEVAPETISLCRELTPNALPAERLFEEWRKLLVHGKRPSRGLHFLRECDWVRFFPELAALIDCPQEPSWHPEGDVWTHTLHALDAFAAAHLGDPREDLIVGLAVLCHDFGKPSTTVFENDRWRSPMHESEGEWPTRSFLARLTQEKELVEAVVALVVTHMRPHQLHASGAGDAAVRRLAHRLGRIDRLVRVAEADARGRPPIIVETYEPGVWLMAQAEKLALRDARPMPLLFGRDLIARGVQPGPKMGEILDELFEQQLEGTFTDRDEAVAYLERYLSNNS
jgi:tRNA nucleotidyltransferase (CCA-adding enzyme)